MANRALENWLRDRSPGVPPPFLPYLLEFEGENSGNEDLAGRGMAALDLSLTMPGGNRDAAFYLLTADAFLTYACESVVKEVNPGDELKNLLQRLGNRFS